MTTFVETKEGRHQFAFECEGCGTTGDLGIPVDERKPFGCPNGCGAMYVMWNNPLDEGKPNLMCVVCPIFEDEE